MELNRRYYDNKLERIELTVQDIQKGIGSVQLAISDHHGKFNQMAVAVEGLSTRMELFDIKKDAMSEDIHEIRILMESFQIVKLIVFGGVGIALVTLVGAIISVVLKRG